MSRSVRGARTLRGGASQRRELRRTLHLIFLPALAALLVYLAWPYVTLWQLARAVADDDPAALSALVDLEAIRCCTALELLSHFGFLVGKLQFEKGGIPAVFTNELVVPTGLHDLPVFNHKDLISMHYRIQAMCDHQCCTVCA